MFRRFADKENVVQVRDSQTVKKVTGETEILDAVVRQTRNDGIENLEGQT